MNKVIICFLYVFITTTAIAQVPEAMNYQAVARNNAGVALANQTIKVRLSILRNAVSLYSETRQVTTNLLGLFNVQIGSPGALSTTGNMTTINWFTNTPNPVMLKVELDLTNTNVFTDMGTQPFSTVPFSFASKSSIETINLAGRYIDPVTVPAINSTLTWNGSAWTPVKKDTVIYFSSSVSSIPAGGANAPWAWIGNKTLNLTGDEIISVYATTALGHASGNFIPVATGICYQNINGGSITSFDANGRNAEFAIPVNTTAPRTSVSAVGSIKNLPAGSYRIGMGIKNKSGTGASLNNNDFVNMVIEIKYR